MKKPKAKPAGSSATEGGAEGDVAGEKDEGDGDEVSAILTVLNALSPYLKLFSQQVSYRSVCLVW